MSILIKEISAQETWLIRHQVMWPNEPFAYIQLPTDKSGFHLGLWVKDELVSVISLFITQGSGQFRKFATLEQVQGKGYGSQLLKTLLEIAITKGVSKIWCNARVEKANFYTKFGLMMTEKRFYKKGLEYVIMERMF